MLGCERFFLPILSDDGSCPGFFVSQEAGPVNGMIAPAELMAAGRGWKLSNSLREMVVGRTQLETSKSPASRRGVNATDWR
jgi:hypothetical protein